MAQLVRDGTVLTPVDIAWTRAARRRGLLGHTEIDGVLVLEPCRQVHTIGMRCPIDVVWCDRRGKVLRMATLRPGRVSRPVLRSRFVIEASAGATAAWGLRRADVVVVERGDDG
jgi:uncharacterized membrane protein (UPF0127 family)